MSAAFFDTNIILYAADSDCPDRHKHDTARRLMRSRVITVSTQVMLETYSVMRRKLAYGPDVATQWIATLKDEIVVTTGAQDVVSGIMKARRFELSHWDGMILHSAEMAGVDVVYSEDMSHGQHYGPVRVCNPFIEDFLA